MFDNDSTVQADLRSHASPWQRLELDLREDGPAANQSCDVLIVGGGITGALAAQHLSALGFKTIVLDRERPGIGSTAASTAMLQWEIDAPLAELSDLRGGLIATRMYRESLSAVSGLSDLVRRLGVNCRWRERTTLYIAGGDVGSSELQREHALRQQARLPGQYLGHRDLLQHFGLDREAAIVSPGSADADPLLLAQGLLATARAQGVRIVKGDAIEFVCTASGVTVGLEHGAEIEARHVILATGYAMPDFVPAQSHSVASSWAIRTVPQPPGSLWPQEALIWEASDSYIYARTTVDGRIIIGGEDDAEIIEPDARDALIGDKSAILQRRLKQLWPAADTRIDTAWAGAFGETEDGLPLIGAVPGMPGVHAAFGYGGNGITFSFMASRIIAATIMGQNEPWFDALALDRKV